MNNSLYTGRSGILIHQQMLDVTSNNLSNVNTVAYKSRRTSFESVLSQKIKNAASPNAEGTRASTNPLQLGLGVRLASIDKDMLQGNPLRTDEAFDIMLVDPEDFLIVGGQAGLLLTRDGGLEFDIDGNLNVNGMSVNGWDAVLNPETLEYDIRKSEVSPITIDDDKYNMGATPTTFEEFTGNLNSFGDPEVEVPVVIYDSQGNKYSMPLLFKYDAAQSNQGTGVWTYEVAPDIDGKRYMYKDGDLTQKFELNLSSASAGDYDGAAESLTVLGAIAFDTSGKIVQPTINDPENTGNNITGLRPPANMPAGSTQYELFITSGENSGFAPGVTFGKNGTGSIILDFTGMTQYNNAETSAVAVRKDGNVAGTLDAVSIDEDGIVYGKYTNGHLRKFAQVAVTSVDNPQGLAAASLNRFTVTANSGGINVQGKEGKFQVGVLESSNVNMGTETTNLVISQRGLQVSSRILTTSDELLRTAIDMKR